MFMKLIIIFIPDTVILLDVAEDGLLLATVQVYSPPVVTVRVWVYRAVGHSTLSGLVLQ